MPHLRTVTEPSHGERCLCFPLSVAGFQLVHAGCHHCRFTAVCVSDGTRSTRSSSFPDARCGRTGQDVDAGQPVPHGLPIHHGPPVHHGLPVVHGGLWPRTPAFWGDTAWQGRAFRGPATRPHGHLRSAPPELLAGSGRAPHPSPSSSLANTRAEWPLGRSASVPNFPERWPASGENQRLDRKTRRCGSREGVRLSHPRCVSRLLAPDGSADTGAAGSCADAPHCSVDTIFKVAFPTRPRKVISGSGGT